MKNILFTKAFEYSVRGYSVIPLRRNKLPLLNEWKKFQETPADDEQIEAWWKTTPNANVGIITGKISGITVVDIDMSHGQHVDVDIFPKTFTVRTPTGGYHLYYKYTPEIKQTANTFPQFPHVDIRSDGGYVVAPPSFCDYIKEKKRVAGTYKIESNFPIADFPVVLFKVKSNNQITEKKKSPSIGQLLVGFNKMEEGDGRNNALTKICGKIIRLTSRDDWSTVGFTLALSANMRFKNPLDEKEVKTIFESITKKESEKPIRQTDLDLISTEKGEPIVNEKNVHTVAKSDEKLKDCMRFNIFTGLVETNFDRTEFEAYQRDDVLVMRMYIMNEYPFLARVSHQTVEDVLNRLANENKVSPPKVWLESLVWDGKSRLDSWISKLCNTDDDEYHASVGSNWMKGVAKRIVEPGCKFDYVLVFEGEQGIKKSTSFRILGGDWHVETTLTPSDKDFFMLFSGKLIVEFSEGETLGRSEAKRLKAVITMQTDKYRVPYDRSPKDFPRQCVFAMTTNESEYLKDETGNRRWLPVLCKGTLNTDWLVENRDQLYAEAYHRVHVLKETVYEFPEEITKAEQEKRQIRDPRVDMIFSWYFTRLSEAERQMGITTQEAFAEAVQKNSPFAREMTKLDAMVIGSIFRSTLHLEKKHIMRGGLQQWRYVPSDLTNRMARGAHELTKEEKAELQFNDF